MNKARRYDVIIIGAGAAGLFAGASAPLPSPGGAGLILEKGTAPGRKLLMAGGGQCNLTHGGNIKDFLSRYGEQGKRLRSILYPFNNSSVMQFFAGRAVPVIQRQDGKVFPESLRAKDVLAVLTSECEKNGYRFSLSSAVSHISMEGNGTFLLRCDGGETEYRARKVIIATGGCSYPTTGSDGSFFDVMRSLGIQVTPLSPALTPVFAEGYPYEKLSGISFPGAIVSTCPASSGKTVKQTGGLLLTHNCFSGPTILHSSRYLKPGDTFKINYLGSNSAEALLPDLKQSLSGNSKQLATALYDFFKEGFSNGTEDACGNSAAIPKRFLELLCSRLSFDGATKASRLSAAGLKAILDCITCDAYRVSGLAGYATAMTTSGGVSLDEIDLRTMESKKYTGLYIIGEALNVDGDTGGYNLQFAFSSGHLAASLAIQSLI